MQRDGSRRFETFEKGLILDAAISFSYSAPRKLISGLGHLEGMEVWCLGDGNVYGPYVVSDATITIDDPVKKGEVGLFCPPLVETLPPSREIADKTIIRRRSRIHSVWISVIDTTSIAIGANGQDPVDFPLRQYDANLIKTRTRRWLHRPDRIARTARLCRRANRNNHTIETRSPDRALNHL